MPSREQKIAASRYRQVRLTFTQETSGNIAWSMYAKGLNQAWDEHQCLARGREDLQAHLHTTEDVISALLIILEGLLLPRRT